MLPLTKIRFAAMNIDNYKRTILNVICFWDEIETEAEIRFWFKFRF